MDYNAYWAVIWQQRMAEVSASVDAEALVMLRAALAPAGAFVTIPRLGKAFHIRYRSDTNYTSIEIVTDDLIRPGHNVVMLLRPIKHPGGHQTVQELIDELILNSIIWIDF